MAFHKYRFGSNIFMLHAHNNKNLNLKIVGKMQHPGGVRWNRWKQIMYDILYIKKLKYFFE